MDKEEREFFDDCVHAGMQSDGYAIEAALRAFRRWRGRRAGAVEWSGMTPELDNRERW